MKISLFVAFSPSWPSFCQLCNFIVLFHLSRLKQGTCRNFLTTLSNIFVQKRPPKVVTKSLQLMQNSTKLHVCVSVWKNRNVYTNGWAVFASWKLQICFNCNSLKMWSFENSCDAIIFLQVKKSAYLLRKQEKTRVSGRIYFYLIWGLLWCVPADMFHHFIWP